MPQGDQRLILHKQDAIRTDPGKILDQGKKKRAVRAKKVVRASDCLWWITAHLLGRTHPTGEPGLGCDAYSAELCEGVPEELLQQCVAPVWNAQLIVAFFASILKDIRMERSKIRPSDNIRTFFLSRFFMEYLLLLRGREAQEVKDRQKKGLDVEEGKTELVLGLVGEMAEMDSVRWVVTRMKVSMDERVSRYGLPKESIAEITATCLDRATSQYRLFHPDRKFNAFMVCSLLTQLVIVT